MRAGLLRERITIKRQSTLTSQEWGTQGSLSSIIQNDVATVSASVVPVTPDETFVQQGVMASTGYEIKMRYRPDILSTDRILWRDKLLDIVGEPINVNQRNRELQIKAVLHAAG